MVLMRGHNICFHWEIRKNIFALSLIPPLIWSSFLRVLCNYMQIFILLLLKWGDLYKVCKVPMKWYQMQAFCFYYQENIMHIHSSFGNKRKEFFREVPWDNPHQFKPEISADWPVTAYQIQLIIYHTDFSLIFCMLNWMEKTVRMSKLIQLTSSRAFCHFFSNIALLILPGRFLSSTIKYAWQNYNFPWNQDQKIYFEISEVWDELWLWDIENGLYLFTLSSLNFKKTMTVENIFKRTKC